ncbi:2-C-methyl-D-erythritol 4-phosphate cytidylyltransferase [Robbsia andropogonis]|uniref:2-C-methyl-D-erythritol 4-phosphate cytidylyltransferase n=1 Tax=Robbsia andropogonis TaxID=28092 RepID=UPI0009E49A98|nr:2-C-methyl-D-erythritol 4-phosphate cytidylyltransferase [Robbsia andropogonis]
MVEPPVFDGGNADSDASPTIVAATGGRGTQGRAAHARLFALIPCAGTGTRAGGGLPKQYRSVAGRNMLYHALAAFDACAEFAQTLIALSPDDTAFDPRRFEGLRYAIRRCGGDSRHATVRNGLTVLQSDFGAQPHDWVLVHDAARPGVTPALIRTLIAAVSGDSVGGIVALPLADTLKRERLIVEAAGTGGANDVPGQVRIAHTEPRDGLWLAQTPQMFRLGLLRDALDAANTTGRVVTDEASAIEAAGYAPQLVRGHMRNFKVTYPEDFALAEAFLQARQSS